MLSSENKRVNFTEKSVRLNDEKLRFKREQKRGIFHA